MINENLQGQIKLFYRGKYSGGILLKVSFFFNDVSSIILLI